MPTPPDQFQRRTYVRLPFTDEYLGADGRMSETLVRALSRPWLTVRIAQSVVKSTPKAQTGSWTHVPSSAARRPDEPEQR